MTEVPAVVSENSKEEGIDFVTQLKEYLSEEKYKLRLYDLIVQETQSVMANMEDDRFPLTQPWSEDGFVHRTKEYEAITVGLCQGQALLGYWGSESHRKIVSLGLVRIGGRLGLTSGNSGWIALRWYPCLLLLYAGGIAAVAAERYDNLRELLLGSIHRRDGHYERSELLFAAYKGIEPVVNSFKLLPGHERHFVPLSEHFFELFQPLLNDLFFLEDDYEESFDRFELLLAFEYANLGFKSRSGGWGPIGRFGWKHRQNGDLSPLNKFCTEAKERGASWPPIQAGLCDGSIDRFEEIANQFAERLSRLGYY